MFERRCASTQQCCPAAGCGRIRRRRGGFERQFTGRYRLASDTLAPIDGIVPTGPCNMLQGTVVYIESGDTQEIAQEPGAAPGDTANIVIAYNLTGSCTLTNDIYTAAKMVPNGTLKYVRRPRKILRGPRRRRPPLARRRSMAPRSTWPSPRSSWRAVVSVDLPPPRTWLSFRADPGVHVHRPDRER